MSRGVRALLASVAVVAAVASVDVWVDPPSPPEPVEPPEVVEPEAGAWVCTTGSAAGDSEASVAVARPGEPGDAAALVTVATQRGGQEQARTLPLMIAGSRAGVDVLAGEPATSLVRWLDGPVAAHREWRIADPDLPDALVAGGCARPLAERWIVPGMTTAGGAEARLQIANPYRTDATVAIGFVTPRGPEDPIALRNVSVAARSTFELVVNQVLPERDDLAAVVDVASGRVVVEGTQLAHAAIGGVSGASLLAAATGPSEAWTVPWVVDGQAGATWLWVVNPGERSATVELTLHTPEGGVAPDGLEEVVVGPGELQRIDLRGTFPEEIEVAALTARSEGSPIVLSGASQLEDDAAERTGLAVQLGVSAADTAWVVSGGPVAGRAEGLHLSNPGSAASSVSVALHDGTRPRRPPTLQDVVVPAGGWQVLPLTGLLGASDGWTAFVTATEEGVVVGRVGSAREGARLLVATPGVPQGAWMPDGPVSVAVEEPGMVQRLRTSQGVALGGPPSG